MKIYCIDREECGYYEYSETEYLERLDGESVYDNRICPECCNLLLTYSDYSYPIFQEEFPPVSDAPDGASLEGENLNDIFNYSEEKHISKLY